MQRTVAYIFRGNVSNKGDKTKANGIFLTRTRFWTKNGINPLQQVEDPEHTKVELKREIHKIRRIKLFNGILRLKIEIRDHGPSIRGMCQTCGGSSSSKKRDNSVLKKTH